MLRISAQAAWLVLALGPFVLLGCGTPPSESPVVAAKAGVPADPVEEAAPSELPGSAEEAAPVEPPEVATEPNSPPTEEPSPEELLEEEAPYPPELPLLPAPEGATAMPEPDLVWVDQKLGTVMVDGYVSLQEGMLEMFACPAGTKEHESVVAVEARAQVVHAALLAVGAEVGTPVQFVPEFKPPTGTEIAIEVLWLDKAGNWQAADAQQWILDIRTEQPMNHPWVFAGSGFWKDEASGEEFYMAESGDFICVSNFSSATLDIPVESSQVNEGLLFEANGAKVPPIGTPVRLVLRPKLGLTEADD